MIYCIQNSCNDFWQSNSFRTNRHVVIQTMVEHGQGENSTRVDLGPSFAYTPTPSASTLVL